MARMKLVEITTRPGSEGRPFALLFVLHDQPPLANALPKLIRDGFEPCEIYFSRVTSPRRQANDPTGVYYEAVFG